MQKRGRALRAVRRNRRCRVAAATSLPRGRGKRQKERPPARSACSAAVAIFHCFLLPRKIRFHKAFRRRRDLLPGVTCKKRNPRVGRPMSSEYPACAGYRKSIVRQAKGVPKSAKLLCGAFAYSKTHPYTSRFQRRKNCFSIPIAPILPECNKAGHFPGMSPDLRFFGI